MKWKPARRRCRPEISTPTCPENPGRNFKYNVIVICKFGFTTEHDTELTVQKGDVLKLLDRYGNGWILVQFIDSVSNYGLIPATYVDIAVNDPLDPVTIQWLHLVDEIPRTNTESPGLEAEINNSMTLEMPMNMPVANKKASYPISTSISNFQLLDNRYRYRVEITYSDNSKTCVCRYYQDFYNLHASLLEFVSNNNDANGNLPCLPKLPEPIPSTGSLDTNHLVSMFLRRCNDLNIYLDRLFMNKKFQNSKVLSDWLDTSYNNSGGINFKKDFNIENNETTNIILPKSVDTLHGIKKKNYDDYYALEKPLPLMSSAISMKSQGHLEHGKKYKNLAKTTPKLTINTSRSYNYTDSTDSPSETSIFSDAEFNTPDTSLFAEEFIPKNDYQM